MWLTSCTWRLNRFQKCSLHHEVIKCFHFSLECHHLSHQTVAVSTGVNLSTWAVNNASFLLLSVRQPCFFSVQMVIVAGSYVLSFFLFVSRSQLLFFLLEIQTNDRGRESSFSLFSLIAAGFLLVALVTLLITSVDVYLKRNTTAIFTLVICVCWTCWWIWYKQIQAGISAVMFLSGLLRLRSNSLKQHAGVVEQLMCWSRFIPALCRVENVAAVLQHKAVMLKMHWNKGGSKSCCCWSSGFEDLGFTGTMWRCE